MFDRDLPPELLPGFAQEIEALGADDLWVVEDLGWTGAISAAATALAATSGIRVCIGITPAPLRNPVLLAMELANLARLYPGRLAAGIGHGVQDWMRQAGAAAVSPLSLLDETVSVVRALLRGETVTAHGREVKVDGVRLVHPPKIIPVILTGVLKPRSLALSGRIAQGTIVPEGFGPAEIAAALDHIAADDHELVVITHLRTDTDPAQARATALPVIEGQAQWLGVAPEHYQMACGTPADAVEFARSLAAAGASTIVFRPIGPNPVEQVRSVIGPRAFAGPET